MFIHLGWHDPQGPGSCRSSPNPTSQTVGKDINRKVCGFFPLICNKAVLPPRLMLTYCSEAWKGVFISLLSQKDLWTGRAEFSWSRRPNSLEKMPVIAPSAVAYRAWSLNTVGCEHTSVHWITEAWTSISDEIDGETSSHIPCWREDTTESCWVWWRHKLCCGLGSTHCPTDSWCLSALD